MKSKRDVRSYDETLTLITIKKKCLKLMDNKRFRIAEIFKSLEQDMVKIGYGNLYLKLIKKMIRYYYFPSIFIEFSSKIFFSIDLFSLNF